MAWMGHELLRWSVLYGQHLGALLSLVDPFAVGIVAVSGRNLGKFWQYDGREAGAAPRAPARLGPEDRRRQGGRVRRWVAWERVSSPERMGSRNNRKIAAAQRLSLAHGGPPGCGDGAGSAVELAGFLRYTAHAT